MGKGRFEVNIWGVKLWIESQLRGEIYIFKEDLKRNYVLFCQVSEFENNLLTKINKIYDMQ